MGTCADVEIELARRGLLLLQDQRLPNIVSIITGETLKSSWWNHRRGHEIFACLERLEAHADVLPTRLINGKVTYVHRKLWRELVSVATSDEPWQTRGLSGEARRLLKTVKEKGSARAKGAAARELQTRLLVRAEEIHTESGRHELELEPWRRWAGAATPDELSPPEARTRLEQAVELLGARIATLPWHRFGKLKA